MRWAASPPTLRYVVAEFVFLGCSLIELDVWEIVSILQGRGSKNLDIGGPAVSSTHKSSHSDSVVQMSKITPSWAYHVTKK